MKTKVLRFVPGANPSYVLNNIEQALDLDETTLEYIDLMQKELAPIVPADAKLDKRNLLKLIANFYLIRGTDDSIQSFFRIFFNEYVDLTYPWDRTFRLSEGAWDSVTEQYNDQQSQASSTTKLLDSYKYQKYSYVLKSGLKPETWTYVFDRLVHPAGMLYFAEVLFTIIATAEITSDLVPASDPNWSYRSGLLNSSLGSQMPGIQVGYPGRKAVQYLYVVAGPMEMAVAASERELLVRANEALLYEGGDAATDAIELEGGDILILE